MRKKTVEIFSALHEAFTPPNVSSQNNPEMFYFLGYGSNTLSGMSKTSFDPHGHLRQAGKQILIKRHFTSVSAFGFKIVLKPSRVIFSANVSYKNQTNPMTKSCYIEKIHIIKELQTFPINRYFLFTFQHVFSLLVCGTLGCNS